MRCPPSGRMELVRIPLVQTAQEIAKLLESKLGAEGVTILQANKDAGWQTVFHLHMHVIPRFHGDALHKPWDIKPATEEELQNTFEKLAK